MGSNSKVLEVQLPRPAVEPYPGLTILMQRVPCWWRETFPGIDNERIFAGVN